MKIKIKEMAGWLATIGEKITSVLIMLFTLITLPFTAFITWFLKQPSVLDDTKVEIKREEKENEN